MNFKKYTRTNIAEMADVHPDETATTLLYGGVSISKADLENGSPLPGDKIARNPENHNDKWLVAKQYFEENFQAI